MRYGARMGWGILVLVSVILVVYDLRYRRLPSLWVLVGSGVVLMSVSDCRDVSVALCGAAVWSGLYFALAMLSSGTHIGGGDIKLALPCGAAVGLAHSYAPVLMVLCAVLAASVLSVGVGIVRPSVSKTIPHGPSMLVSAWMIALLGAPIAVPAT